MPELLEGRAAVAHLLRRAGFGPRRGTWAALAEKPYADVLAAVLAELDAPIRPAPEDLDLYEPGAIQQLWLERMVAGEGGFAEKLTLFWHGHFATSNAKVQDARLMWQQALLLRGAGSGAFPDLVAGISRDVAMIRWLDGNSNRNGHANENYGRELQELFTLGIGNYTEDDIREVARAFTGWGSRHHEFVFRAQFHDAGEKTIHGQTGPFDGDDVVRILTDLPACRRYIATRLLRFFCHPQPRDEDVRWFAERLAANAFHVGRSLGDLLASPVFLDVRNYRALVRSPVEFVVGALRTCGLSTVPPWIHGALDRMGQILFRPPSVKGWTSGTGWLSSGAVVERLAVAQRIAALAPLEVASQVADLAFQDDVPATLAEGLAAARGADRVALALGGPEFQLA